MAEGGGNSLISETVDLIRIANANGIIQSVASRNLLADANLRLIKFGLSDFFLFTQIETDIAKPE
ncbi:MAG: hypothetical protein FWF03_06540, partial [Defluviitaleaceae bacterium]|nr:hypothetical protein [Defluviitaleaceae bacterium]